MKTKIERENDFLEETTKPMIEMLGKSFNGKENEQKEENSAIERDI